MVVLISSFFIFNSMQTIDENSIASLSLAAELSNFIKVRSFSSEGSNLLQSTTPKFLWLLRDFALEFRDEFRAKSKILKHKVFYETPAK